MCFQRTGTEKKNNKERRRDSNTTKSCNCKLCTLFFISLCFHSTCSIKSCCSLLCWLYTPGDNRCEPIWAHLLYDKKWKKHSREEATWDKDNANVSNGRGSEMKSLKIIYILQRFPCELWKSTLGYTATTYHQVKSESK